MRIATYNVDLSRKGPGLLLRDILSGKDKQVIAVTDVIAGAAPDVILLTGFDYDLDGLALAALADRLAALNAEYPYRFSLRPNTGRATRLDLDGDGKTGGSGDAQGYGRFAGADGMAILSRLPIAEKDVADYSDTLWRDLPGALIGGVGLPEEVMEVQSLSTTGHWAVPVVLPDGAQLTLLCWYATPPVFDGPEDRNGRRNHDEAAFWTRLLDGALAAPAPKPPMVLLGDANLDPIDGDGRPEALLALLSDRRFVDSLPRSSGGAQAASQGGANRSHRGDPALDTADWPDVPGPGNLRVDYVLPSADLKVTGSGIWWPIQDDPAAFAAETASRHRLVWVDIDLP
ncbi:endonuclease/exonuclease/phosphatase family protein [Defluviimonas sp. WL0050]|uniref:Endonuclease/exonuclease/phosphatase family protein n=1 Tax=Albidovulum litorale TaxID=2984134 RepID=A0ABT2ZSN9_9RHOB|nr:endonuclease/exonuclease/phosphatase family protein [Defluviimonas sp. WL0050]